MKPIGWIDVGRAEELEQLPEEVDEWYEVMLLRRQNRRDDVPCFTREQIRSLANKILEDDRAGESAPWAIRELLTELDRP